LQSISERHVSHQGAIFASTPAAFRSQISPQLAGGWFLGDVPFEHRIDLNWRARTTNRRRVELLPRQWKAAQAVTPA
jgi:hypothetical protein